MRSKRPNLFYLLIIYVHNNDLHDSQMTSLVYDKSALADLFD